MQIVQRVFFLKGCYVDIQIQMYVDGVSFCWRKMGLGYLKNMLFKSVCLEAFYCLKVDICTNLVYQTGKKVYGYYRIQDLGSITVNTLVLLSTRTHTIMF